MRNKWNVLFCNRSRQKILNLIQAQTFLQNVQGFVKEGIDAIREAVNEVKKFNNSFDCLLTASIIINDKVKLLRRTVIILTYFILI